MRNLAVTLMATAAVGLAAGCGSSGGGSSSSSGSGSGSSASSAAQFRSQMAQLCTNAQQKIDSIKKPQSAKQVVPFLSKTIATAKPYVHKLESAKAPSKLKPTFRQVVALNHQELGLVTDAKKALQKGRKPQLVVAAFQQKANSLSLREKAKWRQLGVAKCAS